MTARPWLLTALTILGGCAGGGTTLEGEELVVEIGCVSCHTDANTDLAPTLVGIWGTEVELEDGRKVMVDEAYVRQSITDPQTDIVAGFDGRMPTFSLTESEVDRLVQYVRSLG